MALDLNERPSPNWDERPEGRAIDMLVLHYTGMADAAGALARLSDPAAKASAHYLVEEEGRVWRLVAEEKRAWHAGLACWASERDVNGVSIGIELQNPGHEFGYRPFPAAQVAALVELASGILARHPIPPCRVLGHSDVAPARKQDPGELFDWRRLARAGIGLWPRARSAMGRDAKALGPGTSNDAVRMLQNRLRGIGYDIAPSGRFDERTSAVVVAFQRHFHPACIGGEGEGLADARTRRLAEAVADMCAGGG